MLSLRPLWYLWCSSCTTLLPAAGAMYTLRVSSQCRLVGSLLTSCRAGLLHLPSVPCENGVCLRRDLESADGPSTFSPCGALVSCWVCRLWAGMPYFSDTRLSAGVVAQHIIHPIGLPLCVQC